MWVDQCRNAGKDWLGEGRGSLSRLVDVSQNKTVGEFRLNVSTPLTTAEQDAARHTIAVEPVGVTTQIVIGDWVSSIADVLAASEPIGNTSIGVQGREQLCCDRSEVAIEAKLLNSQGKGCDESA